MNLTSIYKVPALLLLSIILLAGQVNGQEVLRPLSGNAVLNNAKSDIRTNTLLRTGAKRDTLCLPFIDDFANPNFFLQNQGGACTDTVCRTNNAVYPNDLLWQDELVFINATYPIEPPTYGVATFDGLNAIGKPHNRDNPYGPADTLTSKPIRLAASTPQVWLSFYVEPGGIGDNPEVQDSLLLEFRKADSTWHQVWSIADTNGSIPDAFKIVLIPVTDSDWLYDGFQFRFRNYASRNGNNDHWHLDYVFLDEGRTAGDSLFRDVSFAGPPSSMLQNYQEMPWLQFRDYQTQELSTSLSTEVRNIFNVDNNTNFQDSLYETYSGELIGFTPSESAAIPAGGTNTFIHNNQTIPSSTTNYNEDSMSVTWKRRLNPSLDINKFNDTLLLRQNFYNYYALDDGTAEVAYGLIGTGAKFALKFNTNEPDTVKAIYIHWAYVDGSNSDLFFSAIVFQSIDTAAGGTSDSILYQKDFQVPKYRDGINGFWVYNLDEPVAVDGTFYIGWLQSQSGLLDVGFDRNVDSKEKTWFNLGDIWIPSSLQGTVMMRPRMSADYQVITTVGIEEPIHNPLNFTVFPNPATEHLYFQVEGETEATKWRIYDLTGRLMSSGNANSTSNSQVEISIAQLNSGLYLLEVESSKGFRTARQFVKE